MWQDTLQDASTCTLPQQFWLGRMWSHCVACVHWFLSHIHTGSSYWVLAFRILFLEVLSKNNCRGGLSLCSNNRCLAFPQYWLTFPWCMLTEYIPVYQCSVYWSSLYYKIPLYQVVWVLWWVHFHYFIWVQTQHLSHCACIDEGAHTHLPMYHFNNET